MMLPHTLQDEISIGISVPEIEVNSYPGRPVRRATSEFHFILDKITTPSPVDLVKRPRITDFLKRTAEQFGANLICGRAATGKTYAAVDLAAGYKHVAWLTLDPSDAEWKHFAAYLSAAAAPRLKFAGAPDEPSQIAEHLDRLFEASARAAKGGRSLIVLDGIHHLFDAPWFAEAFRLMLSSARSDTHLLFLSRSKPPLPLWRLRSKQVLNVVEEKMLAFDPDETVELCRKLGVPERLSRMVPANAYGRAGKVVEFLLSSPKADQAEDETSESLNPLFLANTDPFVP